MKLSNALADTKCKDSPVYAEGIKTLILLLAPFAPHIADGCGIQSVTPIQSTQNWPKPHLP